MVDVVVVDLVVGHYVRRAGPARVDGDSGVGRARDLVIELSETPKLLFATAS